MDTLSTGIPFYNSGVHDIRFDVDPSYFAPILRKEITQEKKSDHSSQEIMTFLFGDLGKELSEMRVGGRCGPRICRRGGGSLRG